MESIDAQIELKYEGRKTSSVDSPPAVTSVTFFFLIPCSIFSVYGNGLNDSVRHACRVYIFEGRGGTYFLEPFLLEVTSAVGIVIELHRRVGEARVGGGPEILDELVA